MVRMSPNSPRDVEVMVNATLPDGSQRSMGSRHFRVKQLPKPYAKIGAVETTGRMTANELISKQGIASRYAEDFPFNLNAPVKNFRAWFMYRGNFVELESPSNTWTEEMKNSFRALPSGTRITFNDIRARGNDGIPHEMGPIVITIR